MEVYVLLNQGSEVTLIDQRAADELGLEGEISNTQFHTFHNRDPVINVKEVSLNVSLWIKRPHSSWSIAAPYRTNGISTGRISNNDGHIFRISSYKIPKRKK